MPRSVFLDMTRDVIFRNTFADIAYCLKELGLTVATPAEARTRLGLKGGDQVAF